MSKKKSKKNSPKQSSGGKKVEVVQISLNQIERLENSRATAGDVSELMASIKEDGLLSPLIVTKNYRKGAKCEYLLVAGNRRYQAMFKLGLNKADCFIKDVQDEKELMIINLTENIQRKSTTPFEEGRYMHKLTQSHGMSEKELSVRLSVTLSYVRAAMNAFSQTPEKYRNKLTYGTKQVSGKVPLTTAAIINGIAKSDRLTAKEVDVLYSECEKGKLPVEEVKNIGRMVSSGISMGKARIIYNNCAHVRLDVRISKKHKRDLMEKYDMGIVDILFKILWGEIKEAVTDPIRDARQSAGPKKGEQLQFPGSETKLRKKVV